MRVALLIALVLAATAAPAAGAIRVDDRLTFTRTDGTPVAFPPKLRVFCGPWAGDVPVRAIHVRIGGRHGRWQLDAVLADVRGGRVVRLPNAFVFDAPRGALLFAGVGGIEASSAEEEARGRIVFERARCGPRLRVRVRVEATLGSEFFDGEPLVVRGTFAAAEV